MILIWFVCFKQKTAYEMCISDWSSDVCSSDLSSWFPSAAELSAIAHYQLGQFDQAGALYGRIAKLPDIPKSLQSRSVQMAGMLGIDAVTDRADESQERKSVE